jgi:alkaline phosphatase
MASRLAWGWLLLLAACEPGFGALGEPCSHSAPCAPGLECSDERVCVANPSCGDGVIDGSRGEECDDGNRVTEKWCTDGRRECSVCDATCRLVPLRLGPANKVILFIGDGMGFEQVRAASLYSYGQDSGLSFQQFPYRGALTTDTADGTLTDSAAASTAMATGVAVSKGVVSLALPGDGSPLETILETMSLRGKSTGLVTTTYLTHATPAAFGAHVVDRSEFESIAEQLLTASQPTVLLGGAKHLSVEAATAEGYTVVTSRQELLSVVPEPGLRLSGQFGEDNLPYELDGLGNLPHLSEMTRVAIDVLDQNENGFLLMVEGGRIDHACHANDIDRAVFEVLELSHAVGVALEWAAGSSDTLLLVTADHETGGLQIETDHGRLVMPDVSWSTGGHTRAEVPVFAWGAGGDLASVLVTNTDIYDLMMNAYGSP